MSKQRERDEFLVKMAEEGLPLDVSRKVLRHGATLQRLAEAECNGDYPCDNGERKVLFCHRCESGYVRSHMFRDHKAQKVCKPGDTVARYVPLICQSCKVQDRIKALLAPFPQFLPDFQGDPRGAVTKLIVPSGKTDDWGGTGICVPA